MSMQEPYLESEMLFKIFHPFASNKSQSALRNDERFVHYTSAETAMSIITKKEIWMRNATCMNDFMEVDYGLDCLRNAYMSPAGVRFKQVLHSMFPDICEQIEEIFNSWVPSLQSGTYLTCVSEHLKDEDNLGRLSMWRAYGKASGIALVIKNTAMLSTSDALKAYSNPVAYIDTNGVIDQLNRITDNIIENSALVGAMNREAIKSYVFNVFKFATLCIKHPGFKEEREWRIVYSPLMEQSTHIRKDICAVNGTPQQIYKIPLIDIPEENYFSSISNILDHVIIGPVEYPWAVQKAFVEILANAGVSEPEKKVFVSQIPLRR